MSLSANELVGHLRAAYAKASRLRTWQFILQFVVALPAALSVFVTSSDGSYVLGLAGGVLLCAYLLINWRYRRVRDAAHAARRAALLIGGLPCSLSPAAVLSLRARAGVSQEVARAHEKEDYYATRAPQSPARLAEMIEESAFYSAPLQRLSAGVMGLIIVSFAVVAAIVAFGLPYSDRESSLLVIRVGLAIFVVVVSSDVLGAYFAHKDAAAAIDDVRVRLLEARGDGYPEGDVLLALLDYNAAVEGAPESVPLAYRLRVGTLDSRWAEYQRIRAERDIEARERVGL